MKIGALVLSVEGGTRHRCWRRAATEREREKEQERLFSPQENCECLNRSLTSNTWRPNISIALISLSLSLPPLPSLSLSTFICPTHMELPQTSVLRLFSPILSKWAVCYSTSYLLFFSMSPMVFPCRVHLCVIFGSEYRGYTFRRNLT